MKAEAASTTSSTQRDKKGRSIPVRMALYLNKMFESKLQFQKLPLQFQVELLYLQWVTVQVVSDQITAMSGDGPWKALDQPEASDEAEELVSFTRSYINTQVFGQPSGAESAPDQLLDLLLERSRELTPLGLYSARVLCEMIQLMVEDHGLASSLEERLLRTELLKATPSTVLTAAAIISGLGQTAQALKSASNFCNRLISDIAGAAPGADKTHMSLILLSLCGSIYEKGEIPAANNRIVFAVRQITSWLDTPQDLDLDFSADVCRALSQLLPCMKDVYGSYWEKTLEFCNTLWSRAAEYPLAVALPSVHASLKLVKALETLPEPNDDLEDALKDFSEIKSKALIGLLRLDRDSSSLPLEIVDAMICREVEKIPMRHIPELSDIFPLVASESREIQTAAFSLLHRAIPPQQEQKSVDVLLDKTGKLPPPRYTNPAMFADIVSTRCPSARRAALTAPRCTYAGKVHG